VLEGRKEGRDHKRGGEIYDQCQLHIISSGNGNDEKRRRRRRRRRRKRHEKSDRKQFCRRVWDMRKSATERLMEYIGEY